MGQAKQRGTFEQRIALAQERDAALEDAASMGRFPRFAREDLMRIPMTPEKLEALKRNLNMVGSKLDKFV